MDDEDDTASERVNPFQSNIPDIPTIIKEGAEAAAAEKQYIQTRTQESCMYWLAQAERVWHLINSHGLVGQGKGALTLETNVKRMGISYRTACLIVKLHDGRDAIAMEMDKERRRLGSRFRWPTRAKMLKWCDDAPEPPKPPTRKELEAEIEKLQAENATLLEQIKSAQQPDPEPEAPEPVAPDISIVFQPAPWWVIFIPEVKVHEPRPAPIFLLSAPQRVDPIREQVDAISARIDEINRQYNERGAAMMAMRQREQANYEACHATVNELLVAWQKLAAVRQTPKRKPITASARAKYDAAYNEFLQWSAKTGATKIKTYLSRLGFDWPPLTAAELNVAYRNLLRSLHRQYGSDTHPEYTAKVIEINDGMEILRELYRY